MLNSDPPRPYQPIPAVELRNSSRRHVRTVDQKHNYVLNLLDKIPLKKKKKQPLRVLNPGPCWASTLLVSYTSGMGLFICQFLLNNKK